MYARKTNYQDDPLYVSSLDVKDGILYLKYNSETFQGETVYEVFVNDKKIDCSKLGTDAGDAVVAGPIL